MSLEHYLDPGEVPSVQYGGDFPLFFFTPVAVCQGERALARIDDNAASVGG
jgi:hypothetical protein